MPKWAEIAAGLAAVIAIVSAVAGGVSYAVARVATKEHLRQVDCHQLYMLQWLENHAIISQLQDQYFSWYIARERQNANYGGENLEMDLLVKQSQKAMDDSLKEINSLKSEARDYLKAVRACGHRGLEAYS